MLKRLQIPRRTISQALVFAYKTGSITSSFKANPNYKGGRRKHAQGYVLIKNRDHPRAGKDGYVLEHILIWEKVYDKSVPEGWHIHHLNGIKDDNRPQNLVALPAGRHKKRHERADYLRKQRIRELEAEVRLLQSSLKSSQLIFHIGEN